MGTLSDKLTLVFTADTTQLIKGVKQVGAEVETTAKETVAAGETAGTGLAAGISAGAAIAGTALITLGVIAVKAAADNEAATNRLSVAIQNQGQSYSTFAPQINAAVQQMAKLGFTQNEVKDSIARLVPATHDAGEAIKLQSTAADVAKGAGLDLATATTVLGQAEEGRYRRLIALNVVSNDQIKTMKDASQVIAYVAAVYKGQAAAAAETFSGQLSILKAEATNLAATFGEALLPSITGFLGTLNQGVGVLNNVNTKLQEHGTSLGGVVRIAQSFAQGNYWDVFNQSKKAIEGNTQSITTGKAAMQQLQAVQNQLASDTLKYGASSKQVTADQTQLGIAQGRVDVVNKQLAKSMNEVGQATDNADAATKAYSAAQAQLKTDLGNGEDFQTVSGDINDLQNSAYAAIAASTAFGNEMAYIKANADLAAGAVINLADAEQLLGTAAGANAVDSIGAFNKAAAQQFTLDQAVTDAHDQLASATDNLSKKTGSGGAAGAAKTAAQAWWDNLQKLNAVRDATNAIADDQVALARAQRDNTTAQNDLTTATQHYNDILHGVAANSKTAKDAATSEAAAKDALVTANYDVVDAQKEYNTAIQSGDPETIARAHVKLDDAQRAQAKATSDLAEAQRVLSGTLHGYSAGSQEAKDAQDQLTKAQDKAQDSQKQLRDATLRSQDATNNLKRAQLDLQGAFDKINTGGAQAQLDKFSNKLDTVKGDALKFAQAVSESVAFATNDIAAGFQAEIDTLQQVMASNPLLAHAFDGVINNLINAIVKIRTTPAGGQAAFQQQFASGNLQGFALGGIHNFASSGELALLHGREAILPLHDPQRSMEILSQSGLFTTAQVGGSAANAVVVNVHISALDPNLAVEDAIYNSVKSAIRRIGPLPGGSVAA